MDKLFLLPVVLLLLPLGAAAQPRHHGAHVHGHAQLNLVVSGKQLQVELESPAINLLGFEHRARSEQDLETLGQVLEILRNPERWLRPDEAASCQLQDIHIDSALLVKTEHPHADSGRQDQADGHADFVIVLSYACDQPTRLKSVDAGGLLQSFSGISEIDVQWISENRQSATELSRGQGIIWLQ